MLISQYPQVRGPDIPDTNSMPIEIAQGTKRVAAQDLKYAGSNHSWDNRHRDLIRGQNIGNTFTTKQKDSIKSGSFDDMYIGDYWMVGSTAFKIVDINYFFYTGQTFPHLVIMPNKVIAGNAKLDPSNNPDRNSGYWESHMGKTVMTNRGEFLNWLGDAYTRLFGEYIRKFKIYASSPIATSAIHVHGMIPSAVMLNNIPRIHSNSFPDPSIEPLGQQVKPFRYFENVSITAFLGASIITSTIVQGTTNSAAVWIDHNGNHRVEYFTTAGNLTPFFIVGGDPETT